MLPVKALSILFRAQFRDALRNTDLFQRLPATIWSQPWVVHCLPVGSGTAALKYLAPYIFRVALSNRRILGVENDQITFGYTDGRSGQRKTCTLSAEEFIRRFLQHILPTGFAKVRYYGFLSTAKRHTLHQIRQLLQLPAAIQPVPASRSSGTHQPTPELQCPACGQPMLLIMTLRPRGRCPPTPTPA